MLVLSFFVVAVAAPTGAQAATSASSTQVVAAAAAAPTYLGGADLASLSENVATASVSGSRIFLAASTNQLAVAQAAANASQKLTSAISTASSTTAVLAQIAARAPVPTKVSLLGYPTDFSSELKTAISAAYSLDLTFVSADPVQWSLAAHDAAYRKRIVVGDGAVPHSSAYAAALATSTRGSLVLVDATHNAGVAALIDDPSNISATVLGDYSSLTELQSLSEASVQRITNVPLDSLSNASLRLEQSAISVGSSAKRIVVANADDPATMALAGRYASAIQAVVTDRANATAYLQILRSVPSSTTLVGTGTTAALGAALAAERPTPPARPAYRAIDTTVSATTFTVQYTTLAGATNYTARDAAGEVVATSTTDKVTVPGSAYNLAITATSGSGSVLGTIQYRVNNYAVSADRVHAVIASNAGDGTYIKPLNSAALPRLITRTRVPLDGTPPQASDMVNVAITCEPNYTDPAQATDQQYNYNVYVLSNDPATCEATGTAGDTALLDTLGITLPATTAPAGVAPAQASKLLAVPDPTAPAATESVAQRAISQARESAASSGGFSTQATGDDWAPIMFRYQTFIPTALTYAVPGFSGDLNRPFTLFNGNNRTFDPFGDFKTRQDVNVTFGSSHSITFPNGLVGETLRYKCSRPSGGSCVLVSRARASNAGLRINDVSSNATGGSFTFHVDMTNPLYSLAPAISSDLHVSMGYRNTWIYGRHDNMPLHEIYFDVAGWNEWYMAYASTWYDPVCLAGALPGCSTFVVLPI